MFQKYCVVFQELFVVFADMGHRRNALTVLNESSSSRVFVILTNWSFGPQKNNDLVFEFKGEGCHRTAKSQDNL